MNMTVQKPQIHWALLSLTHVLSPQPEIASIFLSCLERLLLTVDLATLSHHWGLSSDVSRCQTVPIPPSPAPVVYTECLRSREHCGLVISNHTRTTGCLSSSFFRAEAMNFILLSRWLLNVCSINKYVTLSNFRWKEESRNHGHGVPTCHILPDTADYGVWVSRSLFIPWYCWYAPLWRYYLFLWSQPCILQIKTCLQIWLAFKR